MEPTPREHLLEVALMLVSEIQSMEEWHRAHVLRSFRHDLRSSMTGVIGNASLGTTADDLERARTLMVRILDAGEAHLDLVDATADAQFWVRNAPTHESPIIDVVNDVASRLEDACRVEGTARADNTFTTTLDVSTAARVVCLRITTWLLTHNGFHEAPLLEVSDGGPGELIIAMDEERTKAPENLRLQVLSTYAAELEKRSGVATIEPSPGNNALIISLPV